MNELKEILRSRGKLNLLLIGINVAVFLILELLGDSTDSLFMLEHGAMYEPLVIYNKEYYRLFTSMFLHFGVEHLAYNMFLLFFAGDILEKNVGKLRYLLIYVIGGILGNVGSMLVNMHSEKLVVSAGASGAIFSVVGAIVWIVILHRKRLGADYVKRVLLVAILTIVDGFTQTGVDNIAHISGFLTGLILCVITCALHRNELQ